MNNIKILCEHKEFLYEHNKMFQKFYIFQIFRFSLLL